MPKTTQSPIHAHTFDFERLVKETITNSIKLTEYFRLKMIYYQLVSGKGLEFDRIREYQPGMDPRRIDWKIFSRTGKLFVRSYKEERKFDIIVVLDVSDSMLLGSTEMTKNEFAAIIAGTLAFAATESGDEVGVTMFSDKVEIVTDPSSEYYNMLNIISDPENYGGKKDWPNLAKTLISNYTDNSIIFVISDFIDTKAGLFLPELAANFAKVYGIMVRDPLDDDLPANVGRVYLRDFSGRKVYLTNFDEARKEYQVLNQKQIKDLMDEFHDYQQLFFKLKTNEDFATSFIKAVGEEEVIVY
ncbi:MAG: DUF58 domain-containing protein [archaeon]